MVEPGGSLSTRLRQRFERLVRAAFDDLYRFAVRLERDPVRGEDLLQAALIIGFGRFDQLRDEGAFKVWQTRIVLRTYQNRLRRREEASMDPAMVDTATDLREARPDRSLERARLADRLSEALQRLPPDQREAIVLLDVQGLSFPDAARVLGIPAGTVASRVARGRAALRVWLEDTAREEGVIQ